MNLKPMLAYQKLPDLEALRYPVYASPKIDGIRCLIVDGVAVSRSLKPIRNEWVQRILGQKEFNGLDGELVVGNLNDRDLYRNTNSGVMSVKGEPDFRYIVFDRWDRGDLGYHHCLQMLPWSHPGSCIEGTLRRTPLTILGHRQCDGPDHVLAFEEDVLREGYEGLILRDPDAAYKFGRSTLREQALLKIKRYDDSECTIVEAQEAMHNDNEAQTNALGRTERSSSQEGRTRGKGMLGRLICKTPDGFDAETFEIGSFKGLTNEDKEALWEQRDSLPGKTVKFKHFSIGAKDRPRHPVFLGFRDPIDL